MLGIKYWSIFGHDICLKPFRLKNGKLDRSAQRLSPVQAVSWMIQNPCCLNTAKVKMLMSQVDMLTATALIDQPPDVSQLLPVPYFVPVVIKDQLVKIRLIAKTVRTQISFYATNSHDARSVCYQFCTYMQDEDKRRVVVPFEMAGSHIEHSKFTVLENQLFPSPVPSEAINLSIFTIDVQLIGYLPQILGLGGQHDNNTDNGYNPDGSAVEKPLQNLVVIQADKFAEDGHVRIKADRDTGAITVENIHD